MYQLNASSNFKKKFAKLIHNNKLLEARINKSLKHLANDPSYPSLKTHLVNLPNAGSVYSSWVTSDIRIIWTKIDNELILLLLDIGGHSGGKRVYR